MTPKTLTRTIAIKERIRQWRRGELHEAETLVNQAEQSVGAETERRNGAADAITREGECSAVDLALRADQVARSQQAVKDAQAALNTLREEREVRREVVSEATREVRAIEALRTRLVTAEQREADKREQQDSDEAASRKRPS